LKYREVTSAVARTEGGSDEERIILILQKTTWRKMWKLHDEIAEQISLAEEFLKRSKIVIEQFANE